MHGSSGDNHDNDDVAIMMMVVMIRKMVSMTTTTMTTLCGRTTHLGEMICQPAPAYLCSRSWLQIWILYLRVMVWQINMSLLPPDKFVKILVWQMGRVERTPWPSVMPTSYKLNFDADTLSQHVCNFAIGVRSLAIKVESKGYLTHRNWKQCVSMALCEIY